MRFDRHLIHRCTLITPGVVTGKDKYNRDIIEDVVIINVPCRLDVVKKKVLNDQNGVDYVEIPILMFSRKQPINEGVKIRGVADKNGNSLLPGTFAIKSITPVYRSILHHYEVELQKE